MHCNIRDIENIIKGRINYYSYLAKDIDALASGVMPVDEAADAQEYLGKETGFQISLSPVERSTQLTHLLGQCRELIGYYLDLKTCLLHADKDIGIMSLFFSLEYALEEAHLRKAANVVDINDVDQIKQLRSALMPFLPQVYKDLRKGIAFAVNEAACTISITFKTELILEPLRKKTHELTREFQRLTDRMPPNAVTISPELSASIRAVRELHETPLVRQSTSILTKDKSKFIMAIFTRERAKLNAYNRWYEAMQQSYRDLRNVKSMEQLQQAVIAAKDSIQKQSTECVERISVCLLDLDNSHRKLSIHNHLELRIHLENLFNHLQENQNRTVTDLNDANSHAEVQSALVKFVKKLQNTSAFIIEANEVIQQNQIKIIEEKRRNELLRQQSQKAEAEENKENNLKYLAAFKTEQAEKLRLRKAEIAANREKKRLQRPTLFATSTSTIIQAERPATTMAVNQVMYERLINLHEKHLDLIISILQASGGIAYRDVVNLIKNQLAGDIIEHGSSHKTIIIERLAVQVYTNENNQLVAVSETLTAGMAKPHNPGHTEHHLSKWNIKLVRNALVAAGITLSAMEEIIATQEQDRVNQSNVTQIQY